MNFIKKLFSKQQDTSNASIETLIRTAPKDKLLDLMKNAIQNGSDPNETDDSGNTPLRYATSKPDSSFGSPSNKHGSRIPENVIEFLISNGANVNIMNNSGRSPLHYAAYESDAYLAEILLKNGADPAICDPNLEGETPLMTACQLQEDKNPVIELLLQYGADINQRNVHGATALHYSAIAGNTDNFELLVAYDADVNIRDSNGLHADDLGINHHGEDWIVC